MHCLLSVRLSACSSVLGCPRNWASSYSRTENHSKIKFHTHIPHAMCKWPCYFSPQGQRSRFYQMNCTITDERLDVSSNWVKSLPHDFIPRTRISHLGKVTRSNALLSICVIDASFSFFLLWGGTRPLRMPAPRPASQAGQMRNPRDCTSVL